MEKRNRISIVALAITAAFVSIAGCVAVGQLITDSRSVSLGDAQSVNARIEVASGTLVVAGGATELMEADFTYNISAWRPEIAYNVADTVGNLTVKQPVTTFLITGQPRNDWSLRFNDDVPFELSAAVASGDTILDLATLNLSGLDLQTASGDLEVDLSGDMPLLTQVDVAASTGSFAMNLTGSYPSMENVSIATSSGSISLDFNGVWTQDLQVDIDGVSGSITIQLPTDVGVSVIATGISGEINANGFSLLDGALVNPAFGTSDVTLNFDINGVTGNINLELVS